MHHERLLATTLLASALSACHSPASAEDDRIWIYKDYGDQDNRGRCCGLMPARAAETNMVVRRTASAPGQGGEGTAVMLRFDVSKPPQWAGVVFPVIDDYWGDWEAEGLDLSKATKLVFYARGEQGGEQVQVKAAIAGDKPYGDSALVPVTTDWFPLNQEWTRYEIPVDGSQLTRVITPFSVVANNAFNPGGILTLYVDQIHYELADGPD